MEKNDSKELYAMNAMVKHVMEYFIAFLNNPEDGKKCDDLVVSVTQLWWSWQQYYAVHYSESEEESSSIQRLPDYVGEYITKLNLLLMRFDTHLKSQDNITMTSWQQDILKDIVQTTKSFHEQTIDGMSSIMATLEAFAEMFISEKKEESKEGKIIPFQKEEDTL